MTASSADPAESSKSVEATKKRYPCTHDACHKSYSKPSRLAEHERSHTGERPFRCATCRKSYLRESHLHAHSRTHLPKADRPFSCTQEACDKRFWTSQHLRVHLDWHNGSKPFQCSEDGCSETFAKHHQLRTHICQSHSPPGTKPYRCGYEGCTKSFNTNQHLVTHQKVHDARRYTCIQPPCLLKTPGSEPIYFSKWTALQNHIRSVHPPKCMHPSCNGRIFSSQKNLNAHLKLHEQRDLDERMHNAVISASHSGDSSGGHGERMSKRRRGGEVGRDWKCDVEGCDKDFKSKKTCMTHKNVNHLGRRDFVCSEEGCQRTFGYKHLLQRHIAKVHQEAPSLSDEFNHHSHVARRKVSRNPALGIDWITGMSYVQDARTKLLCPYPDLEGILIFSADDSHAEEGQSRPSSSDKKCDHAFSRAYDLRRHLMAAHRIDTDKECLDAWVKSRKNEAST